MSKPSTRPLTTFGLDNYIENMIPDHLQLPSCGLDGDKEGGSYSKFQLLLLAAFRTKVKAANVAHGEQRIYCHLMKQTSLSIYMLYM